MKVGSFKEAGECYERAISRSFFEKRSPLLHWTHLGTPLSLSPLHLVRSWCEDWLRIIFTTSTRRFVAFALLTKALLRMCVPILS